MTAHALAPPFSETQWRRIHTLLEELDDQQALWLSGYLAGQNTDTARLGQKPEDAPALLIAYGTETDNSRELAERFSEPDRRLGIVPRDRDRSHSESASRCCPESPFPFEARI